MSLFCVIICILSCIYSVSYAVYLNETIIIAIDVTIQLPVSQLLNRASSNIQDIIQTSFQDTNQNKYSISSIFEIESISNYSSPICAYKDTSFHFHTILNIYFTSKSTFNAAIEIYQNEIFIDQTNLNTFITLFESDTRQQLMNRLNTDGISSKAVNINSLNMIKGIGNIISYSKQNTIISTTSSSANIDVSVTLQGIKENNITPSIIKDELTLYIIIIAVTIVFLFCLTLTCLWYRHYQRSKKSTENKKRSKSKDMIETNIQKDNDNDNDTNMMNEEEQWFSDEIGSDVSKKFMVMIPKNKDPWKYDIIHVALWLQAHRLQQYYHAFADVNGEKLLKTMTRYELEYKYGIVDQQHTDLLINKINELRTRSDGYKKWRNTKNDELIITRNAEQTQNGFECNYNRGRKRKRNRDQRSYSLGMHNGLNMKKAPLNLNPKSIHGYDYQHGHNNDNSNDDTETVSESETKEHEYDHAHYFKSASPNNQSPKLQEMKKVNGIKYYLSDDDSHDSKSLQKEGDSTDTELNETKKVRFKAKPKRRKRKPPKELRRRASQKKRDMDDSISKSSTIEIIPVNKQLRHRSVEIGRNNYNNNNVKLNKVKRNRSYQINRKSRSPMPMKERRKKMRRNRKESSEGTPESETDHKRIDHDKEKNENNKDISTSSDSE